MRAAASSHSRACRAAQLLTPSPDRRSTSGCALTAATPEVVEAVNAIVWPGSAVGGSRMLNWRSSAFTFKSRPGSQMAGTRKCTTRLGGGASRAGAPYQRLSTASLRVGRRSAAAVAIRSALLVRCDFIGFGHIPEGVRGVRVGIVDEAAVPFQYSRNPQHRRGHASAAPALVVRVCRVHGDRPAGARRHTFVEPAPARHLAVLVCGNAAGALGRTRLFELLPSITALAARPARNVSGDDGPIGRVCLE
eukprot:3034756-Prymnesium_polylepis.1